MPWATGSSPSWGPMPGRLCLSRPSYSQPTWHLKFGLTAFETLHSHHREGRGPCSCPPEDPVMSAGTCTSCSVASYVGEVLHRDFSAPSQAGNKHVLQRHSLHCHDGSLSVNVRRLWSLEEGQPPGASHPRRRVLTNPGLEPSAYRFLTLSCRFIFNLVALWPARPWPALWGGCCPLACGTALGQEPCFARLHLSNSCQYPLELRAHQVAGQFRNKSTRQPRHVLTTTR